MPGSLLCFWSFQVFTALDIFNLRSLVSYSCLSLFSIDLMLCSFETKRGRVWLIFLSLILASFNLMTFEYFWGLEFTRPIIIWLYFSNSQTKKPKSLEIIKKYVPYFTLMILYFIWRFFIFNSAKYNIKLTQTYGKNFIGDLWFI